MLENENTKSKNELISLQIQLKENEKKFEEKVIKITQDNSVSISILLDQRSQAENKLAEFKSKTEADILSKCVEIQQQTDRLQKNTFLKSENHRLRSERNDALDSEEFLLSDIKELKYQLNKAINIPQNPQQSSNHQFRKRNCRR